MASSSLHQIRLFSLLFSKIYLNVHQKIKVDTSHPPTPDPHPGRTALVNAHLALWHMAAWAIWPSINLKSHSLVYSLFYMWVTQVFILSCATLIMALILSSWAQRKSSHFPIQANTHASLLYLVYKVTLGPSFLSSYYFSIIWYKKCLSLFSLTQQDSWIRELTSCSCGPSDFSLIKTAVTYTTKNK